MENGEEGRKKTTQKDLIIKRLFQKCLKKEERGVLPIHSIFEKERRGRGADGSVN